MPPTPCGVPLIVDEAWGSHFGFHPALPANALSTGADLVTSSTHKLAGSLTQSAMLHLADGPFADLLEPLVDRAFRLVQSTSASALLTASLDLARRSLVTGACATGSSVGAADRVRGAVRALGRFTVVSDGFHAFPDIVRADPLRIAIDTRAERDHGPRGQAPASSGTIRSWSKWRPTRRSSP